MTRGEWQYADPDQIALGLAIMGYTRLKGLDVTGGAILITLGDPSVSMQYFGPNRVNHQDLILYVTSIADDLKTQPISIDPLR